MGHLVCDRKEDWWLQTHNKLLLCLLWPASTRTSSQDTYNIAGTIAHQRLGLLEQVGVDQFTLDSLNKWKRRPCFGFDQLHEHRPLRLEVQSLAVRAFRAHNTEHICHAK